MKSPDLAKILQGIRGRLPALSRLNNLLSRKTASLIVVDISSGLKLANVFLRAQPSISALKEECPGGENKEAAILKSLQAFLADNNLRNKKAVLNPALDEIYLKRLSVPVMARQELAQAIKWQIKDELPFDINKAVMDFAVVGETVSPEGAKAAEVICAAVPEEKIRQQVLLLRQAGLECLTVNITAFGYGRIIENYFKVLQDESLAVLDLGQEKSFIAVYKSGRLNFYREFPLSVSRLKESLSGTLATDKGMVTLTPEEIDDTIFRRGIPMEGNEVYKDKSAAPEILSMLRAALERLSSEVKRSLEYYESSLQQGAKIKSVLLANLACRIPYLGNYLASVIPLDFQCFPLEEKVNALSGIDPLLVRENAGNIGIALDYGRGINLLPHEFRTEKIEAVQKISLRWIAFGAFLFLAVSFLFGQVNIAAHKKLLDNALLELKVLGEVQQTKLKLDTLNNFSSEIKNRNVPVMSLMKKLSLIIPQNIFFSDLSLDLILKSGYINGSAALSEERALTEMVNQMNSSGFFIDAGIDILEKEQTDKGEVNKFKILFKLP